MLRIYSPDHKLVYEGIDAENHINQFKNLSGIKNFREEGYILTRSTIENQFPTRAWIALSVCIPLVLILIIAFIVRVFADLFHPREEHDTGRKKDRQYPDFEETRFEKIFSTLGRLNIYSLGVTGIIIVFLFWMIPDLLQYVGKISYQTILQFKWVFLGIIIFAGVFILLKTILSYKTKKEIIRQQAEIQKNRDRLLIEARLKNKLQELDASPTQARVIELKREP